MLTILTVDIMMTGNVHQVFAHIVSLSVYVCADYYF